MNNVVRDDVDVYEPLVGRASEKIELTKANLTSRIAQTSTQGRDGVLQKNLGIE